MPARRNAMSGRIKQGKIGHAMADLEVDDALSGLAPLLRVRPELEDFCRFGGAWASSHEAEPPGWAHFHIVTKGSVELDRPGFGPLRLDAGDILLLSHGDAHSVRAPASHGGKLLVAARSAKKRTPAGRCKNIARSALHSKSRGRTATLQQK